MRGRVHPSLCTLHQLLPSGPAHIGRDRGTGCQGWVVSVVVVAVAGETERASHVVEEGS